MGALAPHDLVRIEPELWARRPDVPHWVGAALEHAPWAVVRRAAEANGIAVGVRGAQRSERYASSIDLGDVLAVRRPEDLRGPAICSRPIEEACARTDAAAADLDLRWGPTGAYGFELASGVVATRRESDFDLVVRADGTPRATLLAFARRCAAIESITGISIDAEVSLGSMGFALAEWSRGPTRILAKTPRGPVLVPCRP